MERKVNCLSVQLDSKSGTFDGALEVRGMTSEESQMFFRFGMMFLEKPGHHNMPAEANIAEVAVPVSKKLIKMVKERDNAKASKKHKAIKKPRKAREVLTSKKKARKRGSTIPEIPEELPKEMEKVPKPSKFPKSIRKIPVAKDRMVRLVSIKAKILDALGKNPDGMGSGDLKMAVFGEIPKNASTDHLDMLDCIWALKGEVMKVGGGRNTSYRLSGAKNGPKEAPEPEEAQPPEEEETTPDDESQAPEEPIAGGHELSPMLSTVCERCGKNPIITKHGKFCGECQALAYKERAKKASAARKENASVVISLSDLNVDNFKFLVEDAKDNGSFLIPASKLNSNAVVKGHKFSPDKLLEELRENRELHDALEKESGCVFEVEDDHILIVGEDA